MACGTLGLCMPTQSLFIIVSAGILYNSYENSLKHVFMYALYTIRRPVYGRIRIPFKRVNPFRTRPFSKQAERLYGRDGNRRDGPSTRRRRERIGAL
jgi:hypothetical protein